MAYQVFLSLGGSPTTTACSTVFSVESCSSNLLQEQNFQILMKIISVKYFLSARVHKTLCTSEVWSKGFYFDH